MHIAVTGPAEELKKQRMNEPAETGIHPDGKHCAAQICTNGHVRHCDGDTFKAGEYCEECALHALTRVLIARNLALLDLVYFEAYKLGARQSA